MTDARDPSKAPDIFTALGLDEPIGDDLVNLPEPGEEYADPGPRQPHAPQPRAPGSAPAVLPPPIGAPHPAARTGTPPSGFQPVAPPRPAPSSMDQQMPPAPVLPPPTRPRIPPPVAPALDVPDEDALTNERKRPSTAEIAAAGEQPTGQRAQGFSGLANMLEPDLPGAGKEHDFSAFEALDAELKAFGNEEVDPGAEPLADPLEGLGSGSALPVFADGKPGTAPAKPPSGGRRRVAPPRQPPPAPSVAPSASASAQRVLNASASGPAPIRDRGPVDSMSSPLLDEDDVPTKRSGPTIGLLVAVCVILAGGLGWVLYTQTDLFAGGDLIERRQEEALSEVQKEAEELKAERDRNKKEYGTILINSNPKGARVWLVGSGPEAEFPNLPVDGEYLVAVVAKGFMPRIRIVKGTELASPVILDLDPAVDPEANPPVPPSRPPKVPQGARETDTLRLKSNTEGAELMLMVGYTPGAQLNDVEVTTPQHLRLTLDGHEPHDIVVKGRYYEEADNGKLAFTEDVELKPAEG